MVPTVWLVNAQESEFVRGDLEGFVSEVRGAVVSPDAAGSTAAALREVAGLGVPDWCTIPDDVAEQLLHHEPGFTIYVLTGRAHRSSTSVESEIGHMSPDVIHAVEYRSAQRPLALHVYHGDLLNVTRRMWNPDGSAPRPYGQDAYDQMVVKL